MPKLCSVGLSGQSLPEKADSFGEIANSNR